MIKSLFFAVVFILAIGMNSSNAQIDPCDCIEQITLGVDAVMATDGCYSEGLWEAPHALQVHLAKLQNWCSADPTKPFKSKKPNIIQGMLETIADAKAGESYLDDSGETVWVNIPAPECALEALNALESLLKDGCPPPPPLP